MKLFSSIPTKQLKGKTVLLRVDLNVHHEDLHYSLRVVRAIKTVQAIRAQGARVVILSHQGRPDPISNFQFPVSRENKKLSLKPFVTVFKKALQENVVFIPEVTKGNAIISKSKACVFVCENLRFWKGEEQNSIAFARQLAHLGDVYVNDAFADSHRAHASVDAITRCIPSYAGPTLIHEIRALEGVRKQSRKHPFVAVVGGAKALDKIELLHWFMNHADSILTGGGVANTFLAWCGYEVGDSVRDLDTSIVRDFVSCPALHIPRDTVISKNKILDIGNKTIRFYVQEIQRSRMVVWNGPVGDTDIARFQDGSRALWRAILKQARVRKDFYAVIGGGETTAFVLKEINAISNDKIPPNIFLSTGGGAMLEFLSGKALPGIQALR